MGYYGESKCEKCGEKCDGSPSGYMVLCDDCRHEIEKDKN